MKALTEEQAITPIEYHFINGSCSSTSERPRESLMKLDTSFILRTLDLYQPASITVNDASWSKDRLNASVVLLTYPFVKPGHLTYVTAPMAMLYASQLSYLAARYMITESLLPQGVLVTDDDFFAARDRGDLVFTRLRSRFRSKISHSIHVMPATLFLHDVRVRRGYIFARADCDLNNGACEVSGDFVMPILGR